MQSTVLERIAKNLADIGAISLEDYLDGHGQQPHPQPPPSQPDSEPSKANAVTRLHQACQRTFRSTDALKFEFIEHAGPRNKQCILTITRPDGVQRAYATQSVFARKNEAKLEAAKIAVDMGALDFLTHELIQATSTTVDDTPPLDALSTTTAPATFVDDIEKCCLDWRAGRVSPHWVPFFDPRSPQKQGCALRVQLSAHVSRVFLSDPTFDTHSDAKGACAMDAIRQGVLDFIKHGNGQTCPASPTPSTSSTSQSPPVPPTTPWTLQAFYDSLPRPFPEPFGPNDASEINPLGWMNNITQNARGGKLVLSFFFTSDGPPGLHGCILKLDCPGEYKASLVAARFPKRSDAKAAVCLQAMSEGIGDYIRSITATIDNKVTPAMRSFSSGLVYPALTSGLSKINTGLHPHFEYHKERDAFGATLLVRLSTSPASEHVRRYTIPSDYRSKADAKVAVICNAAEQGVVEFVRFRGATPPDGYVSPYSLHTYSAEASRKRKRPGSVEDAERGQPAKKKKKGKRRAEAASHGEIDRLTPIGQYLSVHPSGDQIHDISDPGDMGSSQSVLADRLCDPSQSGVGGGGGPGAARSVAYGHGVSYDAKMYAPPYPMALDPRFMGGGVLGSSGHGGFSGAFSAPLRTVDDLSTKSGPSRAQPGASSRTSRRPAEDGELEPGEVVSSAESEFSVSSSRNEDEEAPANERETDFDMNKTWKERIDAETDAGSGSERGEVKETFSASMVSTTVSGDGPNPTTASTASHVKNLMDFCARHGCGTPSFHEMQSQGRFQVWIVIGRERFDLPTTYGTVEEGRQRVAKQVLARLSKGSSG